MMSSNLSQLYPDKNVFSTERFSAAQKDISISWGVIMGLACGVEGINIYMYIKVPDTGLLKCLKRLD